MTYLTNVSKNSPAMMAGTFLIDLEGVPVAVTADRCRMHMDWTEESIPAQPGNAVWLQKLQGQAVRMLMQYEIVSYARVETKPLRRAIEAAKAFDKNVLITTRSKSVVLGAKNRECGEVETGIPTDGGWGYCPHEFQIKIDGKYLKQALLKAQKTVEIAVGLDCLSREFLLIGNYGDRMAAIMGIDQGGAR